MNYSFGVSLPYGERAARAVIESLSASRHQTIIASDILEYRARVPECSMRLGIEAQFTRFLSRLIKASGNGLSTRRSRLLGMHVAKLPFDLRAAHSFEAAGVDIVVGFPGASKCTFLKSSGALRALHMVDAHPEAHNAALERFYGKSAAAEIYPKWLVERIKAEIELADVILVPSRVVERQFLERGVPGKKLALEPYGASLEDPDRSGELPARIPGKPRVAYVGQVSARKNVATLVRASMAAGVPLTVVGRAFDYRQLKIPHSSQNVTYLGQSSTAQVREVLLESDAFAIASIEDACSLVVLEALAAGLPIIATAENGATELVPRDMLSIVNPMDQHDLERALRGVRALPPEGRVVNMQKVRGVLRDWHAYGDDIVARLEASRAGLGTQGRSQQ